MAEGRGRVGSLAQSTARFSREVVLMYSLLVLYKAARLLARDEVADAFSNARRVVHVEQLLGLFTEQELQRMVLPWPGLVRAMNGFYVSAHFSVTGIVLIWLFLRHRDVYRQARVLLIGMTAVALVLHLVLPTAPPRLLPGFVDTGRLLGPSFYSPNSAVHGMANQLAAIPSLHFGWSVLVAWAVMASSRHRWACAIVLYPLATLLTITATANHYWVDSFIALGIFAAMLGVTHRLSQA
jgi:hypothetical protein